MYKYLFLCRVHPKSGLDLAKQNKALGMLRGSINSMPESSIRDNLQESLSRYQEENEGYVMETIPIVSDSEILDPESEVMPEIQKEYPGAEMIRFIEVPKKFETMRSSELVTNLRSFN